MSTVQAVPAPARATREQRRQLRLVVVSSFLGSVIEYYDFLIYASMSGLVFNAIFFSNLDPVTGTIASFATLAAGYFARPIGGVIFGHFGDRIGRKKMLYWSLTIMAGVSFLIGCLPTSEQIGGFAALLLVTLRLGQGIAIGGEWGGAVIMTGEHAKKHRGFWTSFTSAGIPTGAALATGTIALVSGLMSTEDFLSWGWRVPFWASIVLLAVGILVRMQVRESPIFEKEVERTGARRRFPFGVVLAKHWRPFLIGIGFTLAQFVVTTIIGAFILAFGPQQGFAPQEIVLVVAIANIVSVPVLLAWGALSDRIGRRTVIIIGSVATIVMAFALFAATSSGSIVLVGLAVTALTAVCSGPIAAVATSAVPELFPTEVRYSGASFTFQTAGALGGLAPLIFTSILAGTNGDTLPVSIIVAALAVVAIVATLMTRETAKSSLGARVDESEAPIQ